MKLYHKCIKTCPKVATIEVATGGVLSKKTFLTNSQISLRHYHMCFPVNFAKFSRTPILKNICDRLHPVSRVHEKIRSIEISKINSHVYHSYIFIC